ncbi:MAG TPA: ECF transporter S component [Deltaproteobacteria bacterium]|nr:ECF transporter S component [Deltaproteobacteria bacterium]
MSARQLALVSLFMALVAVATMLVRVPIPQTSGYMNLGDSVVLLCGVFFGPGFGFMAGGIGSALADILGGYPQWAPWTLAIKGTEAMLVGLAVRLLKLDPSRTTPLMVLCFVVCTAWMVCGYYVTEVFMYDQKAALAELPANLVQAGGSVVLASLLVPVFSRIMPSQPAPPGA